MLQTRAMLANLTINQWTARKQDKAVAAEVDKTHGANDAGRYNKLLIDKSALEPMAKLASAMRERHYHFTMPWGDNGDRLLPATLYMQYTTEMRALRQEFDAATAAFVVSYPALVTAARGRLGTLYQPENYPAAGGLYLRFGVTISFAPIADANDFRVEVDKDQAEQLRANITATVEARQNDAVKSCYARASEVITKIRDRLSNKEGVFRDSLIDNARTLCEMLPSLNVTGDPALTALCEDMRGLLVSPIQLRRSPRVRQQTADAADAILAKLLAGYC